MHELSFDVIEDGFAFRIDGRDLWDILWLPTGNGCTHLPTHYIARHAIGSVFDAAGARRRVVHVCCCGMESCGTLTADVEVMDGAVLWSALARGDGPPYPDIGPFRFDRAQYDALMERGRALAEAMERAYENEISP